MATSKFIRILRMTTISSISPCALATITQKLEDISTAHSVRILMAVESGSRAWGFSSTNSDYDVRFIYCRSPEAYLDIHPNSRTVPDHIEDTKDEPFDIVGWDIRKAMALLLKGNITPLEWAASEIKYIENSDLETELSRISSFINPFSLFRHHLALADQASGVMLSAYILNAEDDIVRPADFVNPKKMLYALRSYLSCDWILDAQKPTFIPVNIHELVKTQGAAFKDALDALIKAKSLRKESEYCIAGHILREYCQNKPLAYKKLSEKDVRSITDLKADKYTEIDTQTLFDGVNSYIRKEIGKLTQVRNGLRVS